MDFCTSSLKQISEALERGDVTSSELVSGCFSKIKKIDKKVSAFISLDEDRSLSQAEEADKARKKGKAISPFAGIPISIKDNICIEGSQTTCASKMLNNFVPPYDATVIKRLKEKGFIFVGKTNMDEFAMGSSTETSAFGLTRNPWNLDYVPGGSSGGSAVSVGSGMVVASLGSDTGGSIRQPAACCGVIGLKPTYGLVSRYGLIAFASSLDQIGPITRSVEDASTLLEIISGNDPLDSTSLPVEPVCYSSSLTEDGIEGMVVGLPIEYFSADLSPEVAAAMEEVKDFFKGAGVILRPVSLPHSEYSLAAYYIIATAEASSNLGRYDGIQYGHSAKDADNLIDMYYRARSEGFGDEVKRRIMLGTFVLSSGYYDAYYLKAQKTRTLISNDFKEAFSSCDLLLSPIAPSPTFKLGEKTSDPLEMYLSDIFTTTSNIAGIPSISVPCGFTKENLPLAFQLMGNYQEEGKIFKLANFFEKNFNPDIFKRVPML